MKEKWVPEVRHHCPNTPILLLGLKCDLRGQPSSDRFRGEVPKDDAQKLAKEIGRSMHVYHTFIHMHFIAIASSLQPSSDEKVYCKPRVEK